MPESATAEDILHETLPPVGNPEKTSLLLSEKLREVFLPHWSITKNLPTTSKRSPPKRRVKRSQVEMIEE